jgi:hypothetical protein
MNERDQIVGNLLLGCERALRLPRIAEQQQDFAHELRSVFDRNSDELADDGEGIGVGEAINEVELPRITEFIDQPVRDRSQQWLDERPDRAWLEGSREESPVDPVLLTGHGQQGQTLAWHGMAQIGWRGGQSVFVGIGLVDVMMVDQQPGNSVDVVHRRDQPTRITERLDVVIEIRQRIDPEVQVRK